MTKALETIPTENPEAYYERQISATFENGGNINITARSECLYDALDIICKAVDAVPINKDRIINFELSYWHLTEDCDSFEITTSATEADPFDKPVEVIIKKMFIRVQQKFLKRFAEAGIKLIGPRGRLADCWFPTSTP